jgi:hypothetical protein
MSRATTITCRVEKPLARKIELLRAHYGRASTAAIVRLALQRLYDSLTEEPDGQTTDTQS